MFSEEIAVHDVATLLKEFFRDLPEAIVPKELHAGLLAIQSNNWGLRKRESIHMTNKEFDIAWFLAFSGLTQRSLLYDEKLRFTGS